MFEVKIRSGSIRQGQLQEYYEHLREGAETLVARFPGAAQLAMVFLTPGRVGAAEFENLEVKSPDVKRHLAWEELLAGITSALDHPAVDQSDFKVQFLRAGMSQLAELLREIKQRPAIAVTDEHRLARRQFALDVQALVTQRQPSWAALFRPLWTAPTVEEVYLSLDETRRANVYFTVFSTSTVLLDEQGPSTVEARWWVKVAGKHRKALAGPFLAMDRAKTIAQLGIAPEFAAQVEFDPEKLSVVLRAKMLGPRSDLVARCASILERFVTTFQHLLA